MSNMYVVPVGLVSGDIKEVDLFDENEVVKISKGKKSFCHVGYSYCYGSDAPVFIDGSDPDDKGVVFKKYGDNVGDVYRDIQSLVDSGFQYASVSNEEIGKLALLKDFSKIYHDIKDGKFDAALDKLNKLAGKEVYFVLKKMMPKECESNFYRFAVRMLSCSLNKPSGVGLDDTNRNKIIKLFVNKKEPLTAAIKELNFNQNDNKLANELYVEISDKSSMLSKIFSCRTGAFSKLSVDSGQLKEVLTFLKPLMPAANVKKETRLYGLFKGAKSDSDFNPVVHPLYEP